VLIVNIHAIHLPQVVSIAGPLLNPKASTLNFLHALSNILSMIALLTYLLRPSGSHNVLIRHVCLATHMQNLGNIVMVTTITLSPTTLSNNSTVLSTNTAFSVKQKPSEQVAEAEVL
jgi:hypothetical protein